MIKCTKASYYTPLTTHVYTFQWNGTVVPKGLVLFVMFFFKNSPQDLRAPSSDRRQNFATGSVSAPIL